MNVISIRDRLARAADMRRFSDEVRTEAAASRALVALTPADRGEHEAPSSRRPAAFLAELIAAKEQVPQMRERRRAEPAVAIGAYAAAMATKPARTIKFERKLLTRG